MTTNILRQTFGGTWDGGGSEIHGLIEHDDVRLKIELLRSSKWRCTIFDAGACRATASHGDACRAVKLALAALDG